MTASVEGIEDRRNASRAAWAMWALCLMLTGAGIALNVASSAPAPPEGAFLILVIPIGLLSFPTVGALVASRRPDNAVGWLFCVFGISSFIGIAGDSYATFSPGLPGAVWGAVLGAITIDSPFVMAFFVFFLLLFPDGHLPSKRWRHLARYCVAVAASVEIYAAFVQPTFEVTGPEVANPLAVSALASASAAIQGPLYLGLIVCVPLAAASFVLRFRRSRGIEREQMKWFAAAALLMGLIVGLSPLAFSSSAPRWLWPAMFLVGASSIPIAAGAAILRYRLYDIDRIISRTVAYALVTATLGGLFALVALAPTAVIRSGDAPDWVIALATLTVVAAFRPVRRRVQSIVDSRFNRARYDAARTIEAFSTRLRDQTDIDALGAELESVVLNTMQPEHISLWVRASP